MENRMSNESALYPFYKKLNEQVEQGVFLTDKSGVKVVELIAPRIVLNPTQKFLDFEGRSSPRKYIEKEDEWYMSHELKIDKVSDVQIWQTVSDSNKEINSNYGNLVFSRNNFSQFTNVVATLTRHKESRQGLIIYTRPSIHYEWNSHGASDFICTLTQHFMIRNNKLICITQMRSSDVVFGIFSDIPWFHTVIQKMLEALKSEYPQLELGEHVFISNSFHCYERHFDKLKELVENNKQYE